MENLGYQNRLHQFIFIVLTPASEGMQQVSKINVRSVISSYTDATTVTSSSYLMFEHLLESSQRDDSYKCSNVGYGE